MGYFSNGTEGDAYQARYCDQCKHSLNGCAVWDAHILYSYGASGNVTDILKMLIPVSKDGLSNERCTMFLAVQQ